MRAPERSICRICAGCGCPGGPEKPEQQQDAKYKKEELNDYF